MTIETNVDDAMRDSPDFAAAEREARRIERGMSPDRQLICDAKENLRLLEKALFEKRPDGYQSIVDLHAALNNLLAMFQRVEVNGAPRMRCTVRVDEMERYYAVLRENEPR